MENKKNLHQRFNNNFFRPTHTVFETEKPSKNFAKPEIQGEISGLREKVDTALKDKDRRIAELEALLAAKDEEHRKELAEKDKKHQVELKKVQKESLVDALTGLHNRRFFNERATDMARLAIRHNTNFSMLFIDLDKFKPINDTLGHDAGDAALEIVGQIIRETLRPEDEKFRYGGEEFVALLPETEEEGAKAVAERLRITIEEQLIPHLRAYILKTASDKVELVDYLMGTASIGVSSYKTNSPESEAGAEKLAKKITKEADNAAYQAKKEGRNRTVIYQEQTETEGVKTKFFSGLIQVPEIEPPDSKTLAILTQLKELIPDPVERERTLRQVIKILEQQRLSGS